MTNNHDHPTRPTVTRKSSLRYAGGSQLLRASPPAHPATVLSPSRILPLGILPLTCTHHHSGYGTSCRDAPSHVPHESLDRAHAAYMPDTTWAVSGYPPDSSRSSVATPVSMLSNSFRHVHDRELSFIAHLPGPPDMITSCLFPRRSRQRSSANAPRGSLEPSSARRLWRATTSILSCSTAAHETTILPCLAFRVHVHNHTDYRRPHSTYQTAFNAIRGLYFYSRSLHKHR